MSDKEWLQTMDDNYEEDELFADEMDEPQKKKSKTDGGNKRGRKKKKINDGEINESDEEGRAKIGKRHVNYNFNM